MKRSPLLLAIICALLSHTASGAIIVVNFGTDGFTETYSTFTTSIQTSTTYNVTGTDFMCALYGDLPTPVTIPDYTDNLYILKLIATYEGTATTDFQINLFDTDGNERLYQGNFAALSPQNTEVTVSLTYISTTDAFNNRVTSLGLLTAGTGAGEINLQAKSLSFTLVPEPSSYVLCGLGALALIVAYRRRNKSATGEQIAVGTAWVD